MSSEPPPFQESARCDVCKCGFNAFRRRHHCRCCGRTLCHEHSSNQMPWTAHAPSGMPLCICEAPAPSIDAPLPKKENTPRITPQVNVKPKKVDTTPKNRSSSSNSKISSLFIPGQVTNSTSDRPQMDYEVNGEGLREAIKNGDTSAVSRLLREGVDANYRDKQSLSLLHLAAVFNRTDIVFILMEHGASLDYKNAQGETPLDCAPATLQYKMRMKMQGDQ